MGVGKSADVYLENFKQGGLAYKIIRDVVVPYQNEAFAEADFTMKAREVSGDDVVIPTPFAVLNYKNDSRKFYKDKKNIEVLVMKQIDGFTLKNAIANPDLIKNLDIENFCNHLKKFFIRLHEKNIYHRDLHEGNVMIQRDTLKPVVIDFGLAKIAFEEDKPYIEVMYRDMGKGYKEKMGDKLLDDMNQIDKIRLKLRDIQNTLQNN